MQFPIDLEQYDRREQLKKSGLGKVRICFLREKKKKKKEGYDFTRLQTIVMDFQLM